MQNPPIAVETSHHSSSVTVSIFGALSEILSQTTESLSFLTSTTTTERTPLSHTHSTFLSTDDQQQKPSVLSKNPSITDDNHNFDHTKIRLTNAFDPNEATSNNPFNQHTSHEQVDAKFTANSVTQMQNTITSSNTTTTTTIMPTEMISKSISGKNDEKTFNRNGKSNSIRTINDRLMQNNGQPIEDNKQNKPNLIVINSISANDASLKQMNQSFLLNAANESNASTNNSYMTKPYSPNTTHIPLSTYSTSTKSNKSIQFDNNKPITATTTTTITSTSTTTTTTSENSINANIKSTELTTTFTKPNETVTDKIVYVTPEKSVNILDFMHNLSSNDTLKQLNSSINNALDKNESLNNTLVTIKTNLSTILSLIENVTHISNPLYLENNQTKTNTIDVLTDLTTKIDEFTTNQFEQEQVDTTTTNHYEDAITLTMVPEIANDIPSNSYPFAKISMPVNAIDLMSGKETTSTEPLDEMYKTTFETDAILMSTTQTPTTEQYVPRFFNRIPILPIGFYPSTFKATTMKSLKILPNHSSSSIPPIKDSVMKKTHLNQAVLTTQTNPIETTSNNPFLNKYSSTARQPRRFDFFIYGILPNNSVIRKYPEDFYDESDDDSYETNSAIVYGILSNNTVLRKYPNGTIEVDKKRSGRKFEITDIDPKSLLDPYSYLYTTPRPSTNEPSMEFATENTTKSKTMSATTTFTINNSYNQMLNITNSTMNIRSNSHNIDITTISTPSYNSTIFKHNIANSTTVPPMVFKTANIFYYYFLNYFFKQMKFSKHAFSP